MVRTPSLRMKGLRSAPQDVRASPSETARLGPLVEPGASPTELVVIAAEAVLQDIRRRR
jgi:hypothetical protein